MRTLARRAPWASLRTTFAAAMITSLASRVAGGQTAQGTPDSGMVPIKVLYEAQDGGINRPLRVVLSGDNGPAEFEQLWREAHGNSTPMSFPIVDFQREMVIAAAMGFQATIGSQISITRVRKLDRVLEVTVELRPFPTGCSGYPVVTAPIVIVSVPFTLATVVFQDHVIHTTC